MTKKSTIKAPTANSIAEYVALTTIPDAFAQIEDLNTYSVHHETLRGIGVDEVAVAAERAWLESALVLATTPAQTIAEATWKVDYLQACLQAWVLPNAPGRHENTAGMLATAVTCETTRWSLPKSRPN